MACGGPRHYSDAFFDCQQDGSLRSARVVAQIVVELLRPKSVVDVGCGRGTWLRAFKENGVETIRGLDGDYVDRGKLFVDHACFTPVDFARPFKIEGRFDLALCIEVGEHLPSRRSRALVEALTHAAPVVLFSAAVPGQGGDGHINERWPWYWRGLFEKHGFRMLDPIRPRILCDSRVEWWYRQNLVLFASAPAIQKHETLRAEPEPRYDLEWVHYEVLAAHRSFRYLLGALRRRFARQR